MLYDKPPLLHRRVLNGYNITTFSDVWYHLAGNKGHLALRTLQHNIWDKALLIRVDHAAGIRNRQMAMPEPIRQPCSLFSSIKSSPRFRLDSLDYAGRNGPDYKKRAGGLSWLRYISRHFILIPSLISHHV